MEPINGQLQRRGDRDERGRFLPKHGVKSPGRPPGKGIEAAEHFMADVFDEYSRRRAEGKQEDVLRALHPQELAALALKIAQQRASHQHQREMAGFGSLSPEQIVERLMAEIENGLRLAEDQKRLVRDAGERIRREVTSGKREISIHFHAGGDNDL